MISMTQESKSAAENPFKQCPNCAQTWQNREEMLADPQVFIIGYQAHFQELEIGLFLFNHSCGTTFSIEARRFIDLYNGPVFKERKTGSPDCMGYCLKRDCLQPCPAKCECAYVRELVQIVDRWPKSRINHTE